MENVATDADRALLTRALELSQGGLGRVAPNPLVGAVIAREAARAAPEVLGEGFHAELGGRHAEVVAIEAARDAGHDVAGATLYVTLEPCAHHGRQPPCTDAILEAGIGRVVIASDDPSAKASGRGPKALAASGVEVVVADGEEAATARLANQPFRKMAKAGRPLVRFKSAVSLDGFTATTDGTSKWISGLESRALVHRWRAESGAVAVGVETALADDPLLTARDLDPPPARQPARIVFDSSARLPLTSKLVASVADAPIYVIATSGAPGAAALRAAGVEVIESETLGPDRVGAALDDLAARGIDSILLEGGATVAGAFHDAGEIDELRLFIAPILLGDGRPLLAGRGAASPADALRALDVEWQPSGADLLATARLREW